jgi:hypothetical protein
MNEKDAQDINSFFGRVLLIPSEFKRWMVDQFALAVPSIPMSQLVGGRSIERIIDISTDEVSVSGDTEQTIYTLPLRGKTIAENGRLRIDLAATMQDAAASRFAAMNVKIDGVTIGTITQKAFFATPDPIRGAVYIWNRSSYSAQVVECVLNNVFRTITFGTTDLSVDRTLTITVDWASGDGDDIFVKKSAIATVYNPEPATT